MTMVAHAADTNLGGSDMTQKLMDHFVATFERKTKVPSPTYKLAHTHMRTHTHARKHTHTMQMYLTTHHAPPCVMGCDICYNNPAPPPTPGEEGPV